MKNFTQLTLEQRYQLEALLKMEPKLKQKEIALQLGISESTVRREKRRYNKPLVSPIKNWTQVKGKPNL